jgi:hypothetical protein
MWKGARCGIKMMMEMDIQMEQQKFPVRSPQDMYHKLCPEIATTTIRI